MSERDKQTARDIIDAYRRRQQLTQNIILAIGIIAILLIVVIFLLRFSGPGSSLIAQETQTPTMTETTLSTPTDTQAPGLTEAPVSLTSEPPLVEETPGAIDTSTYEVQAGDTLASIALRFNTDLQTLLNLNPEIDPDVLSVGQQIVIPAEPSGEVAATPTPSEFGDLIEYEVVSGDTLLGIAERFNSSVPAIVAENNLENANDIRAGDVLRIPVSTTQASPEATTSTPEATATQPPTQTSNP